MAEDERANIAFALCQFSRTGRRFRRAIEVGCGPTLHNALVLAQPVDELHLADHLPALGGPRVREHLLRVGNKGCQTGRHLPAANDGRWLTACQSGTMQERRQL